MSAAKPANTRTTGYKVVLLGDSGTGKTCLTLRFVNNQFHVTCTPTIGAAFLAKTVKEGDSTFNLQIWDTAGQERFQSLAPMYYRGAQAAIVVFDITEENSFKRAKFWVNELKAKASSDVTISLAGNKSDLATLRQVSVEKAKEYAEEFGLPYFETSAKTGDNVEALFRSLVSGLRAPQPANVGVDINDGKGGKEKGGCKC
eukprot:TRINITY_DN3922_c0_g1_i1.p1 TRINITY_DN3922_c0_g1~~TRINITY_DN3922_c0_g1_i1.p1  ORF type:complete len:201 (-),score=53.74 TRINITY_DN3922_c0_g1_i1:52-654(-)